MKQKALGLAAVAVMLMLVLAQLQQESAKEMSLDESPLLLPGLKAALGSVIEIKILGGDQESRVTIFNNDNSWRIKEKAGYLADFEIVSELLITMADLRVAERKTAKAENHEQLGLADTSEPIGLIVRIAAAGENYEMMVGNESQTLGTFVRRPGEDQVYLVEQEIEVGREPIDYLDPVFFSVESSEVDTVNIQTPDSSLKAFRDEVTKEMVIEDIPQGAQLRYDSVADSLARIFINLRFDDVEPYRAEFFSQPSVTAVTLLSGESTTIRSQSVDEKYWVYLDKDWQYKVSEFTYNELNKSMQDMIVTEAGNEE